ncbi:MAG TPA: DUF4352 domain-containing protein [Candidatus Jeotgalibaca pullicola]|nr:DUF4352 domain-containing protein [Candidatus Jeotgalibaca pullicola]
MRGKYAWLLLSTLFLLSACVGTDADGDSSNNNETNESSAVEEVSEDKTIQFVSGVLENETKGDKYNYYALEGQAEGINQVTAIIEGTAVDIRTTDNQWYFTYPYPGPNVKTEITFTTDDRVEYGQTGIDLADLEQNSYVTVTFIPNEEPIIENPAVSVNEGESQTFRNEDSGIVEVVTVTNIEVTEPEEDLQALGESVLKVEVLYVNEGTATTFIAPNYFTATDGEGHFLPLRYRHFWLKEVEPGKSFTETIYYDVTDEAPYQVHFFDGAWLDQETVNGVEI